MSNRTHLSDTSLAGMSPSRSRVFATKKTIDLTVAVC